MLLPGSTIRFERRAQRVRRGGLAFLITLIMVALACPSLLAQADEISKEPPAEAAEDSETTPIPEIPDDELPPATAERPDPQKDEFIRPSVIINIDEYIEPRTGQPYVPKVRVFEEYIAEYFRRAGHTVIKSDASAQEKARASFVVAGSFLAKYDKVLKFRGNSFAIKYLAEAAIDVMDPSGKVLSHAAVQDLPAEAILPDIGTRTDGLIPDPTKKGQAKRPDEFHAVIDLRRKSAQNLWRQMFHRKGPFGDGEIPQLIASLKQEDPEAEDEPDGNTVLSKLIARRFDAVPYLLEALSDTSPVVVPASYPGLTPANANKLALYHLADKGLEEIFQKVSRMGLDTPDEHRFLIIRGWEQEWRRFCQSFRESPQNPARRRAKGATKPGRAVPTPASGSPKSAGG